MTSTTQPPDVAPSRSPGDVRLPTTAATRYSALAVLATTVGVISFVPGLPSGASAALLAFFVGVGPGCALLAWTGPPQVSRLILVPAVGVSVTILITGAAATIGWWSPHTLFAMIALMTLWSIIPNLNALVLDMVP